MSCRPCVDGKSLFWEGTSHVKRAEGNFSYSWTSPEHQALVRSWADRLLSDGIEVIIDVYDLTEGDDKNAFMEQMVTNSTVSHVLVICDCGYRDKANERRDGVGTESQIISQEVYESVDQSKFVPIVCELLMGARCSCV